MIIELALLACIGVFIFIFNSVAMRRSQVDQCRFHIEALLKRRQEVAREIDPENGFAVPAANFADSAAQDVARTVYQRDMVADLFDRRHVVRRKNHRRPAVAQREDFVFQQVGVDRVEAAERFVENQQGRSVQYRDDELDLLRLSLIHI